MPAHHMAAGDHDAPDRAADPGRRDRGVEGGGPGSGRGAGGVGREKFGSVQCDNITDLFIGALLFRKACQLARGYTRPVIAFGANRKDHCFTSIGAFVVINKDGWFLTADHIVDSYEKWTADALVVKEFEAAEDAINADKKLGAAEKKRKILALQQPADSMARAAAWMWGDMGSSIDLLYRYREVDLAIGKLTNFDASTVPEYPTFCRDLASDGQGTSLARLGYAFITVAATYDRSIKQFNAGPKIATPFFATEGILSRYLDAKRADGSDPGYVMKLLETSTAGLKGQSGGPVFDTKGNIWGIQSKTRHYELGFEVEVANTKPQVSEHQFLNVGWAVSTQTILPLLDTLKVTVSAVDA